MKKNSWMARTSRAMTPLGLRSVIILPRRAPRRRGIHEFLEEKMRGGWLYIMTNQPNGTLYVGVTSDICRRAWEHRTGAEDGFTKRYGLTRLVYVERHDDINAAIHREKRVKHWPRAWKVRLIRSINPDWDDLYETLLS